MSDLTSTPLALKNMREIANRLLARRDYSVYEIEQKLLAKGFDAEVIADFIRQLVEAKLLDDLRFAQNFALYQYRRGKGINWIKQALKQKGVDDAKICLAFKDEEFNWQEQIAKIIRTKKLDFSDIQNKAKAYRFLQARGFTAEQIKRASNNLHNNYIE